jgi:hypothetical protein
MLLRRTLLVCGVLASLLYVATDVLAAVLYGEYHSFTARAVSELMARGAPTERFVDPLFLAYGVLSAAFGIGVWLSAGPRRLLRVMGGSLIAYAVIGLAGPVFFEMNVRGSGDAGDDVPHIVLTAAIVLLMVSTMATGAFVRGPRFRIYSVLTLLVFVVSGA